MTARGLAAWLVFWKGVEAVVEVRGSVHAHEERVFRKVGTCSRRKDLTDLMDFKGPSIAFDVMLRPRKSSYGI
jgi:hypothetical protein